MKKGLLILLIIILILLALYFFLREKKDPNVLTLYGNVDVRQVDMGFRIAGQIEELCFEEGDVVKKGDPLGRLVKNPYDSQVTQAKASLDAIKTTYKNAETLLKRRQELIGISGVSQEDLDNATTTVSQLQANLAQAEANVKVAEDNLSYAEIFSPTDGTILTRVREPGSVVQPSDTVYTISIKNPVWIRAYVTEPQLGKICYGMAAKVYTDSKNLPVYSGKIGFISPIAEFTPKTVETTELRTDLVYRLRIYVDDPDCMLKQGMPVTVQLETATPDKISRQKGVFSMRFDRKLNEMCDGSSQYGTFPANFGRRSRKDDFLSRYLIQSCR